MPPVESAAAISQIASEPLAWFILGIFISIILGVLGWLAVDKIKSLNSTFKDGFASLSKEVEGMKTEMKDMNTELKETNAFIARQAEKNDNYKAEFEEIRDIISRQGILIDDIRIMQNEVGVEHLINHPGSNLKLYRTRHRIE